MSENKNIILGQNEEAESSKEVNEQPLHSQLDDDEDEEDTVLSVPVALRPVHSLASSVGSMDSSSVSGLEDESDASDSETEDAIRSKRQRHLCPYPQLTSTQSTCLNFAMEHRILLKAVLGLLAERDQKATEIGMNDPTTLKSGPLKKASHLVSGLWKIKFVEVRRGMFSYYEDAPASGSKKVEGSLLRKNIPLDVHHCSCRAVKLLRNGLNMAPTGAIFELKIGTQRRLWLAKSKTERSAWIQAINDAMVGGSVTQASVQKEQHGKSGSVKSKSPFRSDLKLYLTIKGCLKQAKSKEEYIQALNEAKVAETSNNTITIPVPWLVDLMKANQKNCGDAQEFRQGSIGKDVDQLWRDLSRDSIEINDQLYEGTTGHGPEKIMGVLTRSIVETSRSAAGNGPTRYAIAESRAVLYARDILLSINRTRSGGDSYYCVEQLLNNEELIVTVPSSKPPQPLSVRVDLDDGDEATDYSLLDKSGWIITKNRIQRSWRKRFFVLSEGILSLYRHATPRPHGLRGQMVVTGASISVDHPKDKPQFCTIFVETKDGLNGRHLLFSGHNKLLAWAYALETTARYTYFPPKSKLDASDPVVAPKVETDKGNQHVIKEAIETHAKNLGIEGKDLGDRLSLLSAKTNSRVNVSVQATTEYSVCTTDPNGDDGDTWATVKATFEQTFRTSGDKIVRGEEVVKIQLQQLTPSDDASHSDKS